MSPPPESASAPDRLPKSLRLTVTHHERGAVILTAQGDDDLESAEHLREQALQLLSRRPPLLVIRLEQVAFLDSQGLATVLTIKRQADQLGTAPLSGHLRQGPATAFRVTGPDSLFEIFP